MGRNSTTPRLHTMAGKMLFIRALKSAVTLTAARHETSASTRAYSSDSQTVMGRKELTKNPACTGQFSPRVPSKST